MNKDNIFVFNSIGDFRMVIGEDKSKVANIVRDNIQHFRILYSNILRDCPQVVYKPQQGKLEVRHGNTHVNIQAPSAVPILHYPYIQIW